MKVGIEEAIAMANDGQSLEGIIIEGLNDSQIKAMDALMLARHGIVIPEQNIYYDDSEIAYDEDFDDVEWSKDSIKLSLRRKGNDNRGFQDNTVKSEEKLALAKSGIPG